MMWLAAPARLRGRGLLWLLVYLAGAALILGAVTWLVARHERDLAGLVAGYFLPESWRAVAEVLVQNLLVTQQKEILVNAVVSGSLVLTSLLLFPIKEKLSATYEREARLTTEPGAGFGLIFEAGEEVKLFLFVLAAQMSIFWLGYPPDPARRGAALGLSYLVLTASFAIDFVSPILQRHGVRFSTAAKTLAKHPFTALAFGACFAAPAALAGAYMSRGGDGIARAAGVIFAVNLAAIAWAVLSGTALGARLIPAARATRRPSVGARAVAWVLLVAALGFSSYRFGAVALTLHKKSAILRCRYDVDWSSVMLDRPGLAGLARGEVEVGLSMDITVENPTDRRVEIEDNRVELRHREKLAARSALPVFSVPAGGRAVVPAHFEVTLTATALAAGRGLLTKDEWHLTLFVAAAPGFEFPVYVF